MPTRRLPACSLLNTTTIIITGISGIITTIITAPSFVSSRGPAGTIITTITTTTITTIENGFRRGCGVRALSAVATGWIVSANDRRNVHPAAVWTEALPGAMWRGKK